MNPLAKPSRIKKTRLAKIYYMPIHKSPDKPWRHISLIFDDREPIIKDFNFKQTFFVTFNRKFSTAGNHYHNNKVELDTIILGEFEIHLEDIDNHRTEKIILKESDNAYLEINPRIAHSVRSLTKKGILLITSNGYDDVEDIHPFAITSK